MVLQIYRIQMPAVPVAPGVRVQLIGVSQDAFSQDPVGASVQRSLPFRVIGRITEPHWNHFE